MKGIYCMDSESWILGASGPTLSTGGFVPSESHCERRDGAKTGRGPWREGQALSCCSGLWCHSCPHSLPRRETCRSSGAQALCPKATLDFSRFCPELLFCVFLVPVLSVCLSSSRAVVRPLCGSLTRKPFLGLTRYSGPRVPSPPCACPAPFAGPAMS